MPIPIQRSDKPARPAADCAAGPPRELDTLVKIVRWRAECQTDEAVFTFLADGEREAGTLTYGELDLGARSLGAELHARGVKGERVLLVFDPGLDYIRAIFGCLYAGAVAVPVYPPDSFRAGRTLPRLKAVINDAQAKLVLTSQ